MKYLVLSALTLFAATAARAENHCDYVYDYTTGQYEYRCFYTPDNGGGDDGQNNNNPPQWVCENGTDYNGNPVQYCHWTN